MGALKREKSQLYNNMYYFQLGQPDQPWAETKLPRMNKRMQREKTQGMHTTHGETHRKRVRNATRHVK